MRSSASLSHVFEAIAQDLPWGQTTRLIVGPLSSREIVKDIFFQTHPRHPVLPAWSIASLAELARDIAAATNPNHKLEKSLVGPSQCDALDRIARLPWVIEAAPEFAKHLKNRSLAMKIARFLSQLDSFYVNAADCEALIEALSEREPGFAAFLSVVFSLWQQGQLKPWSDGDIIRSVLEMLDENDSDAESQSFISATKVRIENVYLWGFPNFTPLEKRFLDLLEQKFGIRVHHIQDELKEFTTPQLFHWKCHAIWDELSFLHRFLSEYSRTPTNPWSEIAIVLPQDELYKRLVRAELMAWRVPLKDPTLPGAWKDNAQWVWWRDALRTMASGLTLNVVKALLGPGTTEEQQRSRQKLYDAAYRWGIHGGVSQWVKLLKAHPVAELEFLVEGATKLSRSMDRDSFSKACEELILLGQKLGVSAAQSEILGEFAEDLVLNRPYLDGFKGRLNRYLPLFEEFLEVRSRRESKRAWDGVWFVGHGVWLPKSVEHLFVLGSNGIEPWRKSDDPLSFEGPWRHENEKVQRLWSKLHFEEDQEERRQEQSAQMMRSILYAKNVYISEVSHDLAGKPWPRSSFVKPLLEQASTLCDGGAEDVGWDRGFQQPHDIVPAVNARGLAGVAAESLWKLKPLRVSAFEDYLKCPFLYYARHVLKLEPDQELSLDPNGRMRGTLLHRILERFLRTELNEGFKATLQQGYILLTELLDQELVLKPLEGLYRDQALQKRAREMTNQQLNRWWEFEFSQRQKYPQVRPLAVEVELQDRKSVV